MVFAIDNNTSTSTAPMTRLEAEEITEAIQGNFNSLGNMLEIARNRKAWKILGYRDFEGYCNNEFGKSQRRAYELIAEAAIAQSLKEADPSLRLPAQSNLKLLKELPIEQQLEAVKRSEWLATESNKKKPNRSDLLIAIDEMEGCRSGDMRASLEARGFTKGVEVATTRGANIGSRGTVTRTDKKGQIYVELHTGGKVPILFDSASLKILSANEKPEKRAWFGTTDIGDKVLIFSKGLENTIGTIKSRLNSDKMVGVEVNGQVLKLSYAELEVVEFEIDEPDQDSWLQNFIWTDFGAQWCYESQTQTITTVYPGLKLHPTEKGKGSPADWLRSWANKNAPNLSEQLLSDEQLISLLQTRLITCGSNERKENLAEAIVKEIWKMSLPVGVKKQIQKLIAGDKRAKGISFALTLSELLEGKKTQTRRAWQDDYARSFIRYFEDEIEIPALNKGQHRGGQEIGKIRLTEKPYQQMLSEMSIGDLEKEGGMCTTVQEFTDKFFEGQDKLVWVLDFEFIASESDSEVALIKQRLEEAEQVISQLVKYQQSVAIVDTVDATDVAIVDTVNTVDTGDATDLQSLTQWGEKLAESVARIKETLDASPDTAVDTVVDVVVDTDRASPNEKLQQEIDQWRAEATNQLQKANYDVMTTDQGTMTGIRARKRKIALEDRLSEIDTLQSLRIGQIVSEINYPNVTKTCPGGWGEILALGFICDGFPQAWVKWNGVELPERHPIRTLKIEENTSAAQPLDAPETSSILVENNTSTVSDADAVDTKGKKGKTWFAETLEKSMAESIGKFTIGDRIKYDLNNPDWGQTLTCFTTYGEVISEIHASKYEPFAIVKVRFDNGMESEVQTRHLEKLPIEADLKQTKEIDAAVTPKPDNLAENNTSEAQPLDAPENPENLALKEAVSKWRKKTKEDIARNNKKLQGAKKADSVKLEKALDDSYSRLLELDFFEGIRIGQTVEKKVAQGNYGKVTRLDFSRGGLPQIWIDWGRKSSECSNVASLNLSPAIVSPAADLDPVIREAIANSRVNLLGWRDHAVQELAEAEEHNQSVSLQKVKDRNRKLGELEAFEKLRIGQFASHRLSLKRGEILAMRIIEGERLEVEMQWESGKKESLVFSDIVPEQMK